MKRLLLRYILPLLLLTCLGFSNRTFAQSVSISNLTNYIPTYTGKNGSIIGFSVQNTGGSNITLKSFGSIQGLNFATYYSGITLYRSTVNNPYGNASYSPVGTVGVSGSTITLTNLGTEVIAPGVTYYYYVGGTNIYSGNSTYIQPYLNYSNNFITLSTNATIGSIGNYAGFNTQPTTVAASSAQNGLASSPVYHSQTDVALFGAGVAVTGYSTITGLTFSSTTNNLTASNYFTNARLYRNTGSNNFSGAAQIASGGVISGGTITFSGLNQAFDNTGTQTYYYFLVADISYTGTQSSNITFSLSSITQSTSGVTPSGLPVAGNTYSVNPTTLSITNLTGGLAASTVYSGDANKAFYGFTLGVNGATTIKQIAINSNNANLGGYLGNIKLVRYTSTTYGSGTPTTVGSAAISGNYILVTGAAESFTNGQSQNYFLVADFNQTTGTLPGTIQFNIASGQTTAAFTESTPVNNKTYNTLTNAGSSFTLNTANIAISGLTGGLSGTTLYPTQKDLAVFGFSLSTSTGTSTISAININSDNGSLSTFYNNFRLYSCPTNSYDANSRTLVGTDAVASGAFVNIALSANQTINSTPKYYFLVADCIYTGSSTNNTTFSFVSGQSTAALTQVTPSSSYNTFNLTGNTYSITQATFNLGSVAGLMSPEDKLYYGSTKNALYGFSAATTGIGVIKGFTINDDLGGVNSGSAFTNIKLYRGTSGTFNLSDTASYKLMGTGVTSGRNITFTFTDTVNNGTKYYYMLVDDIYYPAANYSIFSQFVMKSFVAQSGTTNPGLYSMYAHFMQPEITVTEANNVVNGITQGSLSYGQANIVLFGCKVVLKGAPTLSQINFVSNQDARNYFSNARVYYSTTPQFTPGTAISTGVTINAGYYAATFNKALTPGTYYFWLVVDYTGTATTLTNYQVAFNYNGQVQSPSAFVFSSPVTATYNAYYITGQAFNTMNTLQWTGFWDSNPARTGNYITLTGFTSAVPGANDHVTIGTTFIYNQMNVTAAGTQFGRLSFGWGYASTLTMSGSGTLQLNNGLILMSGTSAAQAASPTITGPLTLGGSAVSYMGPATRLTLGANTTITNNGSFTLRSGSFGTASIATIPSTSSMTGSYVVERYFSASRGYRLMAFPVNNGSGSANFSSMKNYVLITGTNGSGGGFDQPGTYTANGPTILFYSPTTGRFTYPSTFSSASAATGTGFYLFYRGDNSLNLTTKVIKQGAYATPETGMLAQQSGSLNQGNVDVNLSNTGTKFNAVGNPYPSSISITNASLTGTNSTVYTYSPGGNSVTPNSVSSSSFQVASGQGFFLQTAGSGGTYKIAFTEALKSSGQPASLLLGTPTENKEGNIRLQLFKDSANYDYTQMRFLDNYDKNYIDTEDADDLNGPTQTVFFGAVTADNHLVAIASQPIDKQKTSVFLSVTGTTGGIYKINKVDLSNIPDKFDVLLKDHFTGDSVNFRNDTTYSFTIDKNKPATFGNSRFEVVLRKKILPPYALIAFIGRKYSNNSVIKWTTKNEYTYTEFALERSFDGKNYEGVTNMLSTGSGAYSFTDNSSNGLVYYRLKQTDINDKVSYSTPIILLTADTDSDVFSIYPNPTNGILKFSLSYPVKNKVTLKIYNTMGRSISSTIFDNNTGEKDVSALIPGNYIVNLVDNGTGKILAKSKFIKL